MVSMAQTSIRVKIQMGWDGTLVWKGSGRHRCLGKPSAAQRRWQELWVSLKLEAQKLSYWAVDRGASEEDVVPGCKAGMAVVRDSCWWQRRGVWKYQHASIHCASGVQIFHLNVGNWIQTFPSSLDQVHEGINESRIFWIQLLEYI